MTPTHRPFQCLYDRPPLRVDSLSGPSDRLVVAFSSVGHDPDRAPGPEFVASATAQGRPALFVSDASRSWANAPDFADALRAGLAALPAPPRQMLAIGQSMGAFAALAAATVLDFDAVLAFGPQFSVDPRIMPQETRWARWTQAIATFRHPQAPVPPGPRITLLHGLIDDAAQALAFPQAKGLDHVLFPDLSHSGLVSHLKARGALAGLIDAAFDADRRRLLRICASAGGRLRHRLDDQLPR